MASLNARLRRERLAAESGTIFKRWRKRVRIALVYPNVYGVAMANLGFQTVYRLLNAPYQVVCERAFLPEADRGDHPVVTLESGRRLNDFDCVAFSLAFENDYPNVLTLLQKTALPLLSAQRGTPLPLILAGGVAVFLNPEPLAPLIDCFLLGEAEVTLPAFIQRFDPRRERRAMLLELARDVPGAYVPAFYAPRYAKDGTLSDFEAQAAVPAKIQRVYAPHLEKFDTESTVVTPHAGFEDAHLIEVSRGCPRGCRFCAAGFIYRIPRTRPLPALLKSMRKGAAGTRKIGLVGTAVSDLPDLKALCAHGQTLDLQLAFSSLRADVLDDTLIAALRSGRLKTAAIAPEVGSQRLRRVLNKGLTEEDILTAAERLVAGGIPNLKLYFMAGLPTEQAEDITAIVTLVKRIKSRFLRASRARGRMGSITVSLNCFVPKPSTPFQWSAMESVRALKQKLKKIKQGLNRVANVRVKAEVPRQAYLQALLARGDRRVAGLLIQAHANKGNWPQTFKGASLDTDFYARRQRERRERLPWDFIDHGIDKDFLWREYRRSLKAQTSKPCPMDPQKCRICGVCRD